MLDSLAIRDSLQSVAGLALSALLKGCAEVGAGLSGYMGQPPKCGRSGNFGTPEEASQTWVSDSLAIRDSVQSVTGLALSGSLGGCAEEGAQVRYDELKSELREMRARMSEFTHRMRQLEELLRTRALV